MSGGREKNKIVASGNRGILRAGRGFWRQPPWVELWSKCKCNTQEDNIKKGET